VSSGWGCWRLPPLCQRWTPSARRTRLAWLAAPRGRQGSLLPAQLPRSDMRRSVVCAPVHVAVQPATDANESQRGRLPEASATFRRASRRRGAREVGRQHPFSSIRCPGAGLSGRLELHPTTHIWGQRRRPLYTERPSARICIPTPTPQSHERRWDASRNSFGWRSPNRSRGAGRGGTDPAPAYLAGASPQARFAGCAGGGR